MISPQVSGGAPELWPADLIVAPSSSCLDTLDRLLGDESLTRSVVECIAALPARFSSAGARLCLGLRPVDGSSAPT